MFSESVFKLLSQTVLHVPDYNCSNDVVCAIDRIDCD